MSKSQPVVEGEAQPLPCYLCDTLPKVGRIELMTGKTVWTCLCPNHCYETDAYYDRDGAIEEWNRWCDDKDYDYDDGDGWEVDE
jgi:hypothetical protein